MEFMLDTADTAAIKELNSLLNIAGVTTNPSILAGSGRKPEEVIRETIDLLDPEQKLFVQAVQTDFEGIMEEARTISRLRPENIYVKIPVTRDGLKAIRQCRKEGIRTLATAIYSAAEGFLAAQNGADYLAPYTNRICNYGDGVQEVIRLMHMLRNNHLDSRVIAASFKNAQQVNALIEAGIDAVTVSPEVQNSMIDHPATQIAVDEFSDVWNKTYGRSCLFDPE